MNNNKIDLSEYFMPAEWDRHAATQLHWPSNRDTWPGRRLERVESVYLDIIEALHADEQIVLLVDEAVSLNSVEDKIKTRIVSLHNVHLYSVSLNDVWARDCGPVFILKKDGGNDAVITNWDYNAWGEKYIPFDADNRLPKWFANTFGLPIVAPGMVLEGGSVEVNGDGLLLTTESVLLNKNRNPELSKSQIENRLKEYLGVQTVLWLKNGLAGDDTDGHIDDLTRFLNKNTVLTMVTEDPADVNYNTLQENLAILHACNKQLGHCLNIVTLPLPRTRIEGTTVDGSEYVPASYANFYIANGVVLVPLYDPVTDEQALSLFRNYFPERKIIGIPCTDLVWGQGSIHCITQQLYGLNLD